jgi:carbamoyl-phosphate synthase large subunit
MGLDRSAQTLLEHARRERDPAVRATIALAVARRQWEPAAAPGVADLRSWSAEVFDEQGMHVQGFGPATTRLSDMGGPRRPENEHPETPPDAADQPTRTPIVVTGAGGAAGVAVIRALMHRGDTVVGVDADALGAGLALASEQAVVPTADDPAFFDRLCDAVREYHASAVICTVAEEMLAIAGREDELREAGAAIWLSSRTSIETCVDQWAFALAMQAAELPTPATALAADAADIPGPWIVKPRFGRGSRDVHAVHLESDLSSVVGRVEDAIVQTRCDGREFTVDVMLNRNGEVAGLVPRWRLETKAGITTKGQTFENAQVADIVEATVTALGLQAAVNVQGFLADDGSVTIVEVNPRVSGGLSLTQAAGADVVGELLRGTQGRAVSKTRLRAKTGVTMRRYYEEVFS